MGHLGTFLSKSFVPQSLSAARGIHRSIPSYCKAKKTIFEDQFSSNVKNVCVGPPDPVSNLRPTIFPNSDNLTEAEKHFYKVHIEIQQWNQQYWENHNVEFKKARESYIEDFKKQEKKDKEDISALTAEEMSRFYKMFLDKNYSKHVDYNWEWYRKNFYLLWLAARANLSRIVEQTKMRKTTVR